MSFSGHVSQLKSQEADFDEQEIEAINGYDYEQALFLNQAREELRRTNVADATAHYEEQLEKCSRTYLERLDSKKDENRVQYEQALKEAQERLSERADALEASQMNDLRDLEGRWRAAREQEREQIAQTVETLLSSSQLLASSRHYHEAIEMRDKARALQSRVKHASIEECDSGFRKQFEDTLRRHEQAFAELEAQHVSFTKLLEAKWKAADRTAEAESKIDDAYASVEIMNTALEDDMNPEVAIPVVQHFSPRSKKSPSKSRMRSELTED